MVSSRRDGDFQRKDTHARMPIGNVTNDQRRWKDDLGMNNKKDKQDCKLLLWPADLFCLLQLLHYCIWSCILPCIELFPMAHTPRSTQLRRFPLSFRLRPSLFISLNRLSSVSRCCSSLKAWTIARINGGVGGHRSFGLQNRGRALQHSYWVYEPLLKQAAIADRAAITTVN